MGHLSDLFYSTFRADPDGEVNENKISNHSCVTGVNIIFMSLGE
jgi:hypothetical protein